MTARYVEEQQDDGDASLDSGVVNAMHDLRNLPTDQLRGIRADRRATDAIHTAVSLLIEQRRKINEIRWDRPRNAK